MWSVCSALASFVVHAEGKWPLSPETERRRLRKSRGGGDSGPPGSAPMSPLSVASGSLVEPSGCVSERAGCAGSSTPPRKLCVHLLYHPPCSGKRCEFSSVFWGRDLSALVWSQWSCDVEQPGTLTWIFRISSCPQTPPCTFDLAEKAEILSVCRYQSLMRVC